jgi:hypothetical protein
MNIEQILEKYVDDNGVIPASRIPAIVFEIRTQLRADETNKKLYKAIFGEPDAAFKNKED